MYFDYEQNRIHDFIKKENLKIKFILNTHGHIDHILGNNYTREITGAKVYMHKKDWFMLDGILDYAEMFGITLNEKPIVDEEFTEETELIIGDTKLNFLHTPGHSPGGCCIIDHKNKVVFCGDVIFKDSIGRTDLPKCSYEDLIKSIKEKLFVNCGDDYKLYPGHNEPTDIGTEKKYNQFLI